MKSRTSQFAMRTWILMQIVEVGFTALTILSLWLSVSPCSFRCLLAAFLLRVVLHIRVSHFDKQHYSLYLPTCLPHPNKLIQDLHLHCYFLDPSLSYKAQWLIGNTNSHWIPKSWYLIPIVLLLTFMIFLLTPEFPDTFWLPNLTSASTLLNLTRHALLLKRPIMEKENSLN